LHNKQLLGEQASSNTFNLASKIATNKNAQCLKIQLIKCKKILDPKLVMHLKYRESDIQYLHKTMLVEYIKQINPIKTINRGRI